MNEFMQAATPHTNYALILGYKYDVVIFESGFISSELRWGF